MFLEIVTWRVNEKEGCGSKEKQQTETDIWKGWEEDTEKERRN
jgi:hypothetical protein